MTGDRQQAGADVACDIASCAATGADAGADIAGASVVAVRQAAPAGPDGARIRSFGTRRGHLTPGQRAALAGLREAWAVPYRAARLDMRQVFGNEHPVTLEIGCGMGETTARIAADNPDRNFLGIEVYPAGVGTLLRRIEDLGLQNLRVIQADAVEVLENMIAPGALAGVNIFFPDPWPKKRHHKRRLIQAPFVNLVVQRMAIGARLHCATDWAEYAGQMLEVLSAEPSLRNCAQDFHPRPQWRPLTKFEQRGLRLGHPVFDLIFERLG
ncbi:MAG: tRNA (guanosine(46)-N7)-methyltransferase TrmB [Burkholderiaceae bacterium]